MLGKDRAKILFATVSHHGGRRRSRPYRGCAERVGRRDERQQRLAKSLSRNKKGPRNRRDAAAKLGRHHHRVANLRRHFLHQVSNALVKTHDRLVIEDLNVSGMLANHCLARAISDAGWAEFAPLLGLQTGLARRHAPGR
jgi:putative transposase